MPCRGACEPCPGAGPRVTAASNLGGARPPRHKRPATCATSVAFDLALRSGVRGSFAQRYGCYFSLHALALWTRPPQGRQAGQTATGDLALSWKGTRTARAYGVPRLRHFRLAFGPSPRAAQNGTRKHLGVGAAPVRLPKKTRRKEDLIGQFVVPAAPPLPWRGRGGGNGQVQNGNELSPLCDSNYGDITAQTGRPVITAASDTCHGRGV